MEKLRKILHANTSRVKFNNQQQANFFLLLADLLSVGFSVKEALGFIKTVNPKLAPWIASIDKRMQKGASFAQTLQQEVKDDLWVKKVNLDDLVKTSAEEAPKVDVRVISFAKEEAFLQALKQLQKELG